MQLLSAAPQPVRYAQRVRACTHGVDDTDAADTASNAASNHITWKDKRKKLLHLENCKSRHDDTKLEKWERNEQNYAYQTLIMLYKSNDIMSAALWQYNEYGGQRFLANFASLFFFLESLTLENPRSICSNDSCVHQNILIDDIDRYCFTDTRVTLRKLFLVLII